MAVKSGAFAGKIDWPVDVKIGKGLEGAITCETTIGYVDGAIGDLVYRGYSIFDLAEHSTFEETTYLLLYGKLPTKAEYEKFKADIGKLRPIHPKVIEALKCLPKDCHPMHALEVGIATVGTYDAEAEPTVVDLFSGEPDRIKKGIKTSGEIAVRLIAQMGTVAAAWSRIRDGKEPVAPDPKLSHAHDFLRMSTGEEPDELYIKVMDVALILHADHGMNNSTFTCMTVGSTLSDLYSSIVAGIASLKGPLHGGANERALAAMLPMNTEEEAAAYVADAIATKKKLMGFGHRVYKAYDPRAKILGEYSQKVTELKGMGKLYKVAKKVEDEVIAAYGGKGIFPNVDFYSGTIYYAMDIPVEMFTPIFAVSRVSGWVARVLEYLPDNRIFRPRAQYVGDRQMQYVPMDKR
jgi:citrate synthase